MDGQRSKLEASTLGLREGLSHSALLRSIVIVLKVVSAKTIWREKIWNTSLEVRVYRPTKSTSLNSTSLISPPKTSFK
jgi:hypothetical protein